ncbi:glycosyltransferase family 4 protein [Patescibacteria group bacterium]|nr:glycosyltransferase family 4 protein [Patescibacteria group bacterium]
MKILKLLSYYLPNISGITIETQRVSKVLVKRGYEISVLTAQHQPDLDREEKIDGVTIVRLPVACFLGKWAVTPSLLWQSVRYIHQADVVNIHWPYAESFWVSIICWLLRKPLVVTHHTDEPDFSMLHWLPRLFARFALFISYWLTAKVAHVIIPRTEDYVPSSFLLRHFHHKLNYCYPAIYKLPVDKLSLTKLRQRFGRFKYKIGFSGRVSRQKGITVLLEAISSLEQKLPGDFIILFAGPTREIIGERHKEELEPLVKKFSNRLAFLGYLHGGQLGAFYEFIDCLVLPSTHRAESFGQVQVEAMLMGTPVVASDLPGARVPVNKTGMGILVPPGDVDYLAKSIAQVILSPQYYRENRQKVKSLFPPEKVFSFYDNLFQRLSSSVSSSPNNS